MRLYSFVTAAALLSASLMAHADTITNGFALSPFSGYNVTEQGQSFAQFNPSGGTLTSVTYSFNAQGTFSGGGPNSPNAVDYGFTLSSANGSDIEFTDQPGARIGNGTVTSTGSGQAGPLSLFIGTGLVNTSVRARNVGGSSASISSMFGTETVTYNYTPNPPTPPAAATPEPSALVLLGTGLLGMFSVARKRFA